MSVTFKDNDCDDDDNDDDNEDYDNGVVTSSINLWCVGIPTTATAINRTVINIRKKNSNGTLTGIIIIIAVVVRCSAIDKKKMMKKENKAITSIIETTVTR